MESWTDRLSWTDHQGSLRLLRKELPRMEKDSLDDLRWQLVRLHRRALAQGNHRRADEIFSWIGQTVEWLAYRAFEEHVYNSRLLRVHHGTAEEDKGGVDLVVEMVNGVTIVIDLTTSQKRVPDKWKHALVILIDYRWSTKRMVTEIQETLTKVLRNSGALIQLSKWA